MAAPEPSYAYKATLLTVHDGDTFDLRVDRGRITHGILDDPTWTVRLFGIDCWELKQPMGPAARDFTLLQLQHGQIVVQTIHPDLRPPALEKYGRVLARVFVGDDDLADLLRSAGFEKT